MDDDLLVAINNIRRKLKDFTPRDPKTPNLIYDKSSSRISVDIQQFPVPALVLFLLHGVCKFPLGWREERTHWVIPFCYKGIQCSISLEKFGICFYLKDPQKRVDVAEILGKLKKAVEYSEKSILVKMAQEQINLGNITIANHFYLLNDIYEYFKNLAKDHFKTKEVQCFKPEEFKNMKEGLDDAVKRINADTQAQREGTYNALAMIDAYFSRLEHFFVLALPFVSFDRESDDLSTFVGSSWSEKMKRLLPWKDSKTQSYYSRLLSVKENYRNTFAHGGFEKKGASFFFHLPSYGAIPGNMSGYKNSVHFNFLPLEESSYNEVCNLFDEFDHWLKTEALPSAWIFAESTLNLRFDQNYLDELAKASSSVKKFEKWIEWKNMEYDMHNNADY